MTAIVGLTSSREVEGNFKAFSICGQNGNFFGIQRAQAHTLKRVWGIRRWQMT
jgi:hypothetical protein